MKEYLSKNSSGNYQLVNHRFSEDDIEVPSGAKYMTMPNKYFWRDESPHAWSDSKQKWTKNSGESMQSYIDSSYSAKIVWQRESLNDKIASAEVAREKHNHYKKDVSHLKMVDPYRIADLYNLHPCAEHIMKKSLCAGNRGHKDKLRDIQDIIDTAERWKQMIEEDNHDV